MAGRRGLDAAGAGRGVSRRGGTGGGLRALLPTWSVDVPLPLVAPSRSSSRCVTPRRTTRSTAPASAATTPSSGSCPSVRLAAPIQRRGVVSACPSDPGGDPGSRAQRRLVWGWGRVSPGREAPPEPVQEKPSAPAARAPPAPQARASSGRAPFQRAGTATVEIAGRETQSTVQNRPPRPRGDWAGSRFPPARFCK